jgi:thiamine biosynthesis lipoprotein
MTSVRRARPLLGTLVEIRVETDRRQADTHVAIDRAFATIARVQSLMSYHDPASELSRLNREAVARPVPVSEDTWQVLRAAQWLSELSAGLFDITVAPVLARAGFLPRHAGASRMPGRGCWRDVELLPGRRVRFTRELCVDLGGIAKGYAVDCAVQVLRESGIGAGAVNAGGDLRVLGESPGVLHLRHPLRPTELVPVPTQARAAATSAGYFRSRRYAGQPSCAIVHPHRRAPCAAGRSVTVFADDCMTADALTKVIYADPARGEALLSGFRARAVLLDTDPGSGDLRVYDSAGGGEPSYRFCPA